jgi:uncharacterized membrane protein YccC
MTSSAPFYRRVSGIHYAARIVTGCLISWIVLQRFYKIDPIWAMISAVVVSEPEYQSALNTFKSRVLNTLIGCAVALLFLILFGPHVWSVMLAVATVVLICANFVRVPGSWKIAPITVLIIMTPGVLAHSTAGDIGLGLRRTGQVLFGGFVAVVIAYLASKFSSEK